MAESVTNTTVQYSKYYEEMDKDAKPRYEEKIRMIGLVDPYYHLEGNTNYFSSSRFSTVEWYEWPEVTYADVFNYLINTTSYCTFEQLRAYRSMEAFNFLVNGWVTNIVVVSCHASRPRIFILMALVKHSQRLTVPAVKVWVATKNDGEVMCAHCSCMAGLGEACSHIAALLFAAQTNTELKTQYTCTSLPCSWLPPSFRSVPFAEIAEIDFSSASQKRKRLMKASEASSSSSDEPRQVKKRPSLVSKPNDDDKLAFFDELSQSGGSPVILSLISGYNEAYIPLYEAGKVMKPLTELHSVDNSKLPYPELLQKCEEVLETVSFSFSQAQKVEEMTRTQADSRLWYQQRAGRVTTSKLRQVLHTDISQPSLSLITAVCYPETYKAMPVACKYGCEHETTAREKYVDLLGKSHDTFFVIKCGLILHPSFPFFGATPDGIVNCSCHGPGVLEIKCPFRCKDSSFKEAATQGSFCLEEDGDSLRLKEDHAYYYQVQLQMKLCQVDYADFVVWREEDLFIQRIGVEREFIDDAMQRAEPFVKLGILPELVGKWFTRQKTMLNKEQISQQSDVSIDSEKEVWCYCKKGEDYRAMIGCDNKHCPIEWFHFSCIQMDPANAPKGKWYCPECHTSKKGKSKKVVQ